MQSILRYTLTTLLLLTLLVGQPITLARAQAVEPERTKLNMIPGNTATFVGLGGDQSFFQGGTIIRVIQKVFNFFVTYQTGPDGKAQMTVPKFDREGQRLHYAVASSKNETSGPLIPAKLTVELPQKHPDKNSQNYYQAGVGCSNESEKQKTGTPDGIAVSEGFDEHTMSAIGGSAIASAMFGAIIENGKMRGIPSLLLDTPTQIIAEVVNGKFVINAANRQFMYGCNTQSIGQDARQTTYNLLNADATLGEGSLDFAKTINTTLYNELLALINAGRCLSEPQVCAAKASQALGLGSQFTIFFPGGPYLYNAYVGGLSGGNVPADVTAFKGFTNAFLPRNLGSSKSYDEDHGLVKQALTVKANPENTSEQKMAFAGAAGIQEADNKLGCLLTQSATQKTNGQDCSAADLDIPTNTSDWAMSSNQSPISADFTIPPSEGNLLAAVVNAVKETGLPQCVLEGVAYIESGFHWDPKATQCKPNQCSAAGPFQITVGYDGNGSPACPQCASGWVQRHGCPDGWPNDWPKDKNSPSPCEANFAAKVAAQKLYRDGDYGNTGKSALQKALDAGYHYYGSRKGVARLGGCSYGEFVYKHCTPSYVCKGGQ